MKLLLSPTGLILIVLVALIIFGPKRLPDLGKSFRKGMREFKEESQAVEVKKPSGDSPDSPSKAKEGGDRPSESDGA